MTNPIKKEKKNRKNSGGFSLEELYRKALLHYYQKIQNKIPEIKYKLENPIGFEADKTVTKIEMYCNKVLGKEILNKKEILRLFSFRKTLSNIIKNNLGTKTEESKMLIQKIDVFIGGKDENP